MHSKISPFERILKAIEEYNRYRTREAEARLISVEGDRIKVEIAGSFCYTCGFYDYLEDLVYELEDNGVHGEISEVEERGEGAIVTIKLRG